MTIYVPLIVMVVGLLVFLYADKLPSVKEVGRLMFAVGLLVLLLTWPHSQVVVK